MDNVTQERPLQPTTDRYCKKCEGKMTWVWGSNLRMKAGGCWQSRCHPCMTKRRNERDPNYQKQYRESLKRQNPDYWRESVERRRANDPNHFYALRERFFERHPDYVGRKNLQHRARKMGITVELYQMMLEEQNFVCACCGNPETNTNTKTGKVMLLSIDHCHETGKVRSLLCNYCNRALGMACEDPKRLRALADYAEHWHSIENEEKL